MIEPTPDSSIEAYRHYLTDQLCWIDGSPTCTSSDSQRQCTSCRVKWSYVQLHLEFTIFEQFCNGEPARRAAINLGCSRNTVMSHYRSLLPEMEDLVARMLIEERIATTPQTVDEVIRLEKALRAGSVRRRGLACRFLFLNSLSLQERLEELFTATLAKNLKTKIQFATQTIAFREGEGRRRKDSRATTILKLAVDAPVSLDIGRPTKPLSSTGGPQRLIESISDELGAFIAKHYPPSLPSPACRKLGKKWVSVWKECQKLIQSHRS
jgi:hypothetical protein